MKRLVLFIIITAMLLCTSGCNESGYSSSDVSLTGVVSNADGTLSENEPVCSDAEKALTIENQVRLLSEKLSENCVNIYITYGAADFDSDGKSELFAVFSKGDQGYVPISFYSVSNESEITEIFSAEGFCRDGTTYFMTDSSHSELFIFSDYIHSYSLKSERIDGVLPNGKVRNIFKAEWTSDSASEELKFSEGFVDSSEVSERKYKSSYTDFLNSGLEDVLYIYDGKLFLGKSEISCGDGDNVYLEYIAALKTAI